MTDKKYLKWILKEVGCDADDIAKFSKLFSKLYQIEFTYILPRDENRAADGIALRRQFDEVFGTELHALDEPCSVLEMLIALSIRMENEIFGDPADEHPERWFWIMLDNLDILGHFNAVFCPFSATDIEEKVSIFVNRRYKPDGKGNIFPIKNSKTDQRKVEIWYQMQEFCQK